LAAILCSLGGEWILLEINPRNVINCGRNEKESTIREGGRIQPRIFI
jgi:hypothetical protein